MPYDVPPDLAGMSLAEIAEAVKARKLPPVSQWDPAEVGESHMRIAADGRWFHEGSPISRPAMVRAFAGLLRKEDDGFWLVVPYQKLSIEVEDAPFIATDLRRDEDGAAEVITFRLNTDDFVTADADHPITVRGTDDAPRAYVHVRAGLEARLDRSTWLQLAEIALSRESEMPQVSSKGATFSLEPEAA